MSSTTNHLIRQYIAQLAAEGATGLKHYEQKLGSNAKNPVVVCNLLFEGRAALMFLRNGFKVAMQGEAGPDPGPDLQIELDKEVVYVEVTHFLEKAQDRVDERRMQETTDLLVPYGDPSESEGARAWTQMANKAKNKARQYMSDAPNILVFESSSVSLELELESAVHQYDDNVLKSDDLRLRRLSAMMLVNTCSIALRGGASNVEFCRTAHATVPLSKKLTSALTRVRIG